MVAAADFLVVKNPAAVPSLEVAAAAVGPAAVAPVGGGDDTHTRTHTRTHTHTHTQITCVYNVCVCMDECLLRSQRAY